MLGDISQATDFGHHHQAPGAQRPPANAWSHLVLGDLGIAGGGWVEEVEEGRPLDTIGNFGTFTITKRPARKGRNPQTGEATSGSKPPRL